MSLNAVSLERLLYAGLAKNNGKLLLDLSTSSELK